MTAPLLILQSGSAAAPLLPLRILAALGFVGMLMMFAWVLRHRRGLKRLGEQDRASRRRVGARDNLLFLTCVMTGLASVLLLVVAIGA